MKDITTLYTLNLDEGTVSEKAEIERETSSFSVTNKYQSRTIKVGFKDILLHQIRFSFATTLRK
jgi:hypothetical protein